MKFWKRFFKAETCVIHDSWLSLNKKHNWGPVFSFKGRDMFAILIIKSG